MQEILRAAIEEAPLSLKELAEIAAEPIQKVGATLSRMKESGEIVFQSGKYQMPVIKPSSKAQAQPIAEESPREIALHEKIKALLRSCVVRMTAKQIAQDLERRA